MTETVTKTILVFTSDPEIRRLVEMVEETDNTFVCWPENVRRTGSPLHYPKAMWEKVNGNGSAV